MNRDVTFLLHAASKSDFEALLAEKYQLAPFVEGDEIESPRRGPRIFAHGWLGLRLL
jgi:hypothetical protein